MRTFLGIVVAAVAVSACGVSDSTVGASDTLEDGAALSSTSRTYVGIRIDTRRCASPMCGGYWVHDLNRVTLSETYVSGLDFSVSGLSDADQSRVFEAPGDVVLRGKLGPKDQFGTRPFVVSDAWRGLPGLSPAAGESFYKVETVNIECFVAPCPTLSAVRTNYTAKTLLHELSLTGLGFVDQSWLAQRSTQDGALVAGSIVRSTHHVTLEASNVYLKLPENVGPCPAVLVSQCPSGQVRTYTRTADRCVVADLCVTQGICNYLVPNCGEGYTSTSWKKAPNACPAVACDPSWLFE
jgi:hypothetical protein